MMLPTRARHRQSLIEAADEIERALERMDDATLAAEHLRLASDSLVASDRCHRCRGYPGSIFPVSASASDSRETGLATAAGNDSRETQPRV
ncbi:MAG: hypothetical protein H6891_14305 [Brucellaceae bacterium]|nr:hypothetical protein [Brucellaceae bacterium]